MDEINKNRPYAQLLTVADVAHRWRKPRQWIYSNWRRIGLKPIAIGQQLRFRLEDLEGWEQARQDGAE